MIRQTLRWNIRKAILEEHSYVCHYCGSEATEVDHIIPVKHMGDDRFENLIASCYSCNRSKGVSALPEEKLRGALAVAKAVSIKLLERFPDYTGDVYYTTRDIRKTLALPEALWVAVTEYRFASRVASETEAVRQLLQRGIACEIMIKRRMAVIKAKEKQE